MAYNIRSQEYQIERQANIKQETVHQSITSTSEKMSEDDYRELTSFHHAKGLYTDCAPRRKFRKHTRSYERRFTIDPNQTFITVRKFKNEISIEVSGPIHPQDKVELLANASLLPIGLTLTVFEAFEKVDAV